MVATVFFLWNCLKLLEIAWNCARILELWRLMGVFAEFWIYDGWKLCTLFITLFSSFQIDWIAKSTRNSKHEFPDVYCTVCLFQIGFPSRIYGVAVYDKIIKCFRNSWLNCKLCKRLKISNKNEIKLEPRNCFKVFSINYIFSQQHKKNKRDAQVAQGRIRRAIRRENSRSIWAWFKRNVPQKSQRFVELSFIAE